MVPRLPSSASATTFCLALASLWVSTNADSCAPYPVSIPISNVTLSNGNIARGLNVSVGSPAQPLAWLIDMYANNSFVYGTADLCNGLSTSADWSDIACITWRGGQYIASHSSTGTTIAPDAYPSDSYPPPSNVSYTADLLTLNANVSIPDHPIGTVLYEWNEQGYEPQMILGMGTNSSVIQTLLKKGKIASDSFGFYWGATGATPDSQTDGQLVLGGYDRAKIKGNGFTLPLKPSSSCPTGLLVTLDDMMLDFVNGTIVSIMQSVANPLQCCLVPHEPTLIVMPWNSFFEFNSYTNMTNDQYNPGRSYGLYYYGLRYTDGFKPFGGDLTLKLHPDFSITVANDLLVVPHTTIDQDTGAYVANTTEPDFIINPETVGNTTTIGRQFFSQIYLYVNRDAGTFTLWTINPTLSQDLVATDSTGNVVTTFCSDATSTANTTSTTAPSSSATAHRHVSNGSGLSTGAIAGIVVAGVVVAAIVVAVGIVALLRRRKKGGNTTGAMELQQALQHDTYSNATTPDTYGNGMYKKPASLELPAENGLGYQVHELS